MSTPYSRIPTLFPRLSTKEVQTRKLAKASLFRKIAEAQNFLWAHGRVYGAHGYEGNGNFVTNKDSGPAELVPGGSSTDVGICICTFFVPENWNSLNTIKISYRTVIDANCLGTLYAVIEDLTGNFISVTAVRNIPSGTVDSSFTVTLPVTGEYQCRILFNMDSSSVSGDAGHAEGTSFGYVNHISARYLNDTTGVDQTWFEFPTDFFSNFYPVASVFLNKLIRNTLHLWATRTPEICQASLMQNWWNTSAFTEIARYKVWLPHTVKEIKGQLYLNVTGAGGAGNEIRILFNGTVMQTFTALAAGSQSKDVGAYAVTGNAEATITVEAKSTVASADYGVVLLGVGVWESDATPSAPASYKPLDMNGLEGDDPITAQDTNGAGQRAGFRQLMNNDKWLAKKRLRVLVGDWLHRTQKRGPTFASGVFDPRVDWTRSMDGVDTPARPKNITILHAAGDEDVDAMGTWQFGKEDAQSGWNAGAISTTGYPPFIYPYSLTYNGHGIRLGRYRIFAVFTGAEGTPRLVMRHRARRVPPFTQVDDGTGTGPLSSEGAYLFKAYLDFVAGVNSGIVHFPFKAGGDDRKSLWCPAFLTPHDTAPYDAKVRGRLLPQSTGQLQASDNTANKRPEGMMFEVEVSSSYVADAVLTELDLQTII